MACAMQKYSLGMGAGTADRQTDHDEKSCMYVRAGQSKSRAEQQKGGCKVAGRAKWDRKSGRDWRPVLCMGGHTRPGQ